MSLIIKIPNPVGSSVTDAGLSFLSPFNSFCQPPALIRAGALGGRQESPAQACLGVGGIGALTHPPQAAEGETACPPGCCGSDSHASREEAGSLLAPAPQLPSHLFWEQGLKDA